MLKLTIVLSNTTNPNTNPFQINATNCETGRDVIMCASANFLYKDACEYTATWRAEYGKGVYSIDAARTLTEDSAAEMLSSFTTLRGIIAEIEAAASSRAQQVVALSGGRNFLLSQDYPDKRVSNAVHAYLMLCEADSIMYNVKHFHNAYAFSVPDVKAYGENMLRMAVSRNKEALSPFVKYIDAERYGEDLLNKYELLTDAFGVIHAFNEEVLEALHG